MIGKGQVLALWFHISFPRFTFLLSILEPDVLVWGITNPLFTSSFANKEFYSDQSFVYTSGVPSPQFQWSKYVRVNHLFGRIAPNPNLNQSFYSASQAGRLVGFSIPFPYI